MGTEFSQIPYGMLYVFVIIVGTSKMGIGLEFLKTGRHSKTWAIGHAWYPNWCPCPTPLICIIIFIVYEALLVYLQNFCSLQKCHFWFFLKIMECVGEWEDADSVYCFPQRFEIFQKFCTCRSSESLCCFWTSIIPISRPKLSKNWAQCVSSEATK